MWEWISIYPSGIKSVSFGFDLNSENTSFIFLQIYVYTINMNCLLVLFELTKTFQI